MDTQINVVGRGLATGALALALLFAAAPSFAACAALTSDEAICDTNNPGMQFLFAGTEAGTTQSNMSFTSGEIDVYFNGTWHSYDASSENTALGSGNFDCPPGSGGSNFGSLWSFQRTSGDVPSGSLQMRTDCNGGAQWSATSNQTTIGLTCP